MGSLAILLAVAVPAPATWSIIIVARRGDIDGQCTQNRGCANGHYWMRLNVKNQSASDPDPVDQLRERFDARLANRVGLPDAAVSRITITPKRLLNDGVYEVELTAGMTFGRDCLAVRVADATSERYLIPSGRLKIQDRRADLNGDGVVDHADLLILLQAYGLSAGGDIDDDGDSDLSDLATLLGSY